MKVETPRSDHHRHSNEGTNEFLQKAPTRRSRVNFFIFQPKRRQRALGQIGFKIITRTYTLVLLVHISFELCFSQDLISRKLFL